MIVAFKNNAGNSQQVIWSGSKFYWAVLDIPAGIKHKTNRTQLDYLFESVLPIPVDDIHAVYYPLLDAKGKYSAQYLACGINKSTLEDPELFPKNALSLQPETLPEFLHADASCSEFDVSKINLLTGNYEPIILQQARRRWIYQTAVFLLILTVLIITGLEIRYKNIVDQSISLQQVKQNLYQQALDNNNNNSRHDIITKNNNGSQQPLELQFTALLRQLRLTHQVPTNTDQAEYNNINNNPHVTNVVSTITELFSNWPNNLYIQTDSISITPTSLTMISMVPTTKEAELFAERIDVMTKWIAQQPEITTLRDGLVRITSRFRPGMNDKINDTTISKIEDGEITEDQAVKEGI